MEKRRFQYRDAGLVAIFAFLAIQVAGLFLAILTNADSSLKNNYLLSSALINLALLATYLLFVLIRRIAPVRAAHLTPLFVSAVSPKMPPKAKRWQAAWMIPTFLVLTLLLQYATYGTLNLVDDGLRAGGYKSRNLLMDIHFREYGAGGFWASMLIMGVVTGIAEELIFRGALLRSFSARFGETKAILLCGFGFMLYHMSPDQTIFQFLFGLLLGLMTLRTGSILPAVFCHAFNNILSIILIAEGMEERFFAALPSPALTAAVAIPALVLGGFLLPLAVDALTGNLEKNYLVKLRRWILENRERGMENGGGESFEKESNQNSSLEKTPPTPSEQVAKSGTHLSTVLLILSGLLCIAVWLYALITGFITPAIV